MTTVQLFIFLLVVLVLAGAGWFVSRHLRLRRRFGPEYQNLVDEHAGFLAAEREMRQRERRHRELELRELDPTDRERYAHAWQDVQAQFIADPAGAVVAGDRLVTEVIERRGYPVSKFDNFDDEVSYLSVEHARTLGHFRDAHEIYLRGQRGEAGTEELRQALVHYRALFAELLGADPVADSHGDLSTEDPARDRPTGGPAADRNTADRPAARPAPAARPGPANAGPPSVPTQPRSDAR